MKFLYTFIFIVCVSILYSYKKYINTKQFQYMAQGKCASGQYWNGKQCVSGQMNKKPVQGGVR